MTWFCECGGQNADTKARCCFCQGPRPIGWHCPHCGHFNAPVMPVCERCKTAQGSGQLWLCTCGLSVDGAAKRCPNCNGRRPGLEDPETTEQEIERLRWLVFDCKRHLAAGVRLFGGGEWSGDGADWAELATDLISRRVR